MVVELVEAEALAAGTAKAKAAIAIVVKVISEFFFMIFTSVTSLLHRFYSNVLRLTTSKRNFFAFFYSVVCNKDAVISVV
ncbi:hypothetical protein LCB40_02540 [Lactobacillus corticis]|uniref:Uncharacterized protein n=1 Tax=Lactobacillus corticis TaxID=2201249 RepID=A0A916QFI7_9LACO|nr:hypothetical protein LCB40_02540 [Lactobacillus corticis]